MQKLNFLNEDFFDELDSDNLQNDELEVTENTVDNLPHTFVFVLYMNRPSRMYLNRFFHFLSHTKEIKASRVSVYDGHKDIVYNNTETSFNEIFNTLRPISYFDFTLDIDIDENISFYKFMYIMFMIQRFIICISEQRNYDFDELNWKYLVWTLDDQIQFKYNILLDYSLFRPFNNYTIFNTYIKAYRLFSDKAITDEDFKKISDKFIYLQESSLKNFSEIYVERKLKTFKLMTFFDDDKMVSLSDKHQLNISAINNDFVSCKELTDYIKDVYKPNEEYTQFNVMKYNPSASYIKLKIDSFDGVDNNIILKLKGFQYYIDGISKEVVHVFFNSLTFYSLLEPHKETFVYIIDIPDMNVKETLRFDIDDARIIKFVNMNEDKYKLTVGKTFIKIKRIK